MSRSVRSLAASIGMALCLWPVGAGAQTTAPVAEAEMSAAQARDVFVDAGFQVDQPLTWDWLKPPVSSFRVYDPATGRVVTVLVYPSADAAADARLQADASGASLVAGFGSGVWHGNVVLVQSTQAELDRDARLQAARDDGQYTEPIPAQTSYAVDLDFLQALTRGAVNL